jgi:hypothetical protein
MAMAPAGFGEFSNNLLVANFNDGPHGGVRSCFRGFSRIPAG